MGPTMTSFHMALAVGLASILSAHAKLDDWNQPFREAEACQVTLEALQNSVPLKRQWRLVQDRPERAPRWRNERFILQSFPGEAPDETEWRWFAIDPDTSLPIRSSAPSAAMAKAFVASTAENGVNCRSARDLASKQNALVRSGRQSSRVGPDGFYTKSNVMVEKAILSPDGAEALVYIAVSSGPLAGGGHLVLFRKQPDATWREVSKMGVWIS